MKHQTMGRNWQWSFAAILISVALVFAMPALAAKGGNSGGGGGDKPDKGSGGGGGGKPPPTRVEGAGDSIMRGYNADCTSNTG